MKSEEVVAGDERTGVFGECRGQNLLGSAVGGAVVSLLPREAEATEHTEPVGIQGEKARPPGQHEDLVRPGLPDHGELGQGLPRLGKGQAQRCSEITLPVPDRELGGLAQTSGSNRDRDGSTETGNGPQRGIGRCQDRSGCQPDLTAQRRKCATPLGVGHQIGDLLPEDERERIAADGAPGLPVVPSERRQNPAQRGNGVHLVLDEADIATDGLGLRGPLRELSAPLAQLGEHPLGEIKAFL